MLPSQVVGPRQIALGRSAIQPVPAAGSERAVAIGDAVTDDVVAPMVVDVVVDVDVAMLGAPTPAARCAGGKAEGESGEDAPGEAGAIAVGPGRRIPEIGAGIAGEQPAGAVDDNAG